MCNVMTNRPGEWNFRAWHLVVFAIGMPAFGFLLVAQGLRNGCVSLPEALEILPALIIATFAPISALVLSSCALARRLRIRQTRAEAAAAVAGVLWLGVVVQWAATLELRRPCPLLDVRLWGVVLFVTIILVTALEVRDLARRRRERTKPLETLKPSAHTVPA